MRQSNQRQSHEERAKQDKISAERFARIWNYCAACLLIFLVAWIVRGEWIRASLLLVSTLALLVARLIHYRRPVSSTASWCLVLTLLALDYCDVIMTGMVDSHTIWTFPLVAILGAHLLGSRCLPWLAGAITFLICSIHALDALGWESPIVFRHKHEMLFGLIGITFGYCRVAYLGKLSLESKIAQFEADTSQTMRARQDADRASMAKTVFLANLSQQIRVPLNGALKDSRALRMRVDAEHREEVIGLDDCVGRISNIVRDIVEISRMETRKFVLAQEKTSPRELLDILQRELTRKNQNVHIEFEYCLEGDGDLVCLGDQPRLSRLFLLCAHHCLLRTHHRMSMCLEVEGPQGGSRRPTILLRLAIEHDGGASLVQSSEEIFGLQMTCEDHEQEPEMGLGLSMAQRLAEKMDGRIIESIDEKTQLAHFVVEVVLRGEEVDLSRSTLEVAA